MLFSKLGRRLAFTYGRIGALMTLALLATVAFYSPSSASLDRDKARDSQVAAGSAERQAIVAPGRLGTFSPLFLPQAPPPPETIATYDATCTTPKTTFDLNETVCLKTTGVPVDSSRSVTWSDPASFEVQRTDLVSSPNDTYMLPATQTSVIDGVVVENRGTWTVKVVLAGRSGVRASATFTVKDPDNPAFDLNVYSAADTAEGDVPAGTNLTVQTTVTNFGPNDAADVELVQEVPSNATFVSGGQISGPPTFNCVNPASGGVGTSNCTIASLPAGGSADFTFVYLINVGAPKGTLINSLATVTPNTTVTGELHTPDNAWTARAIVTDNPNTPTCAVGCPANITVSATSASGAIVNFANDIESSGDCGTVTASPASGSTFPVGTTTVNVSSTQGASCSFTVTVLDTPAPTITCAADQTAQATGAQIEVSVTVDAPTATGTNVTITGVRNDNRSVSDPYPVGTTTITWTATECTDPPDCADPFARFASCMQHIIVTSADAPTITCPTDRTFTAAAGECQKTVLSEDIGLPSTGGTGVTVTNERSDGLLLTAPYPAGDTFITWTATNVVGSASCTQKIHINAVDNEPPTLTVPPDVSVTTSSCSALLDDELGVATATDNCSSSVNITRTGVPLTACSLPNVCPVACPIPGNPGRTCVENFVFPVGTTDVTYTAIDAAGNSVSAVQHVTVHEPTPPTFTFVPGNVGPIFTGPGATSCVVFVGDATLGTAIVSDNCDTTVIRSGVPAGNNFPVGQTIITYTAKADITVTATQTVTVVDNTPPTITGPADSSAFADANCQAPVPDYRPGTTAADNCGNVSLSQSPAPGTLVGFGPHNVVVTADDGHGNTANDTVVFTVNDNTPPVFTSCPSNITLEPTCPTGAIATYATPTATDNCGVTVTRTAGPASGSVFPIGTTTVTYTADDGHGNTATCTFTVTVRTPQAVIQSLITSINASSLTGTQKNGLLAKLNAALDAINGGQTNVACNKLDAFVNSVGTLISHGDITAAQGNAWISSANHVRNTIGCTNLPCS